MSDSDAKDNFSDSSSRDSILKTSRLNTPSRGSVLRPSLFTTTTTATGFSNDNGTEPTDKSNVKPQVTPTLLEDSSSNPFLKDDSEQKSDQENKKNEENKDEKNDKDLKNDPLSMLSKNGLQRSNLFAATKNSIPRVEQSGFVFGQNVHERVTGAIESTSKQDNEINKSSEKDDSTNTGGSSSSGLLFSSAIQNNKVGEALATTSKENENKSLTEVAREYEESRAQKRKYEEVETFTGEENEVNILDINCKLFAFVNRNWEERGRGSLRLNDPKDENGCSRVVFRTSGNLRLLVNTKVWKGMVAERPSQKSLRLTAMDNNGQIKVFLVMSRPDDINTLYKALTERISNCKSLEKSTSSNGNGSNDDNDSDDKANNQDVEKDESTKSINETENFEKENNEETKKEEAEEVKNITENIDEAKTNKVNDDGNDDNDGEKYEPSPKKPVVEQD